MILNNCQEQRTREAIDWFNNSSEQVFQIAGEAGTGKSVVLHEIVRRLNLKPYEVMPMAYTGQASMVMRKKGFFNAKTCHSSIFIPTKTELVIDGKVIMDPIFNTPVMTVKYIPVHDLGPTKLIIIDEAPMVPLSMRPKLERYGVKMLVAGDLGQLPPVADEPAFLYTGKVHILDEIMRQKQDSAILYIAHRCRRGLPIHTGVYTKGQDIVFVLEEKDLNYEMLRYSDIVICGKNKTRDKYNRIIREDIRHFYNRLPQFGERIICRKNNWDIYVDDIALANGLAGTVVKPPSVESFNKASFTIDFLPDLSDIAFVDLACDYQYFTATQEEKVKKKLKDNPFNQDAKFEFAYALTDYLAQGAEYNQGVYIQEYLRGDIQNNLDYTGVTRFREGLIFVTHSKRFF